MIRWQHLGAALILASTAMLAGCGADCEGLCEDGQECEGADSEDCEASCEKTEKLNEAAGCEDQYDDLLSCIDDAEDICKSDSCDSEGGKYVSCIVEYCASHSDSSECT